jgi:hypothetical protein
MKTYNAIRSKWMRLISGIMAGMFLTLSFVGQASAKILFEDDLFLNVQSEGMILDSNNNTASGGDITLQFGNTGATDGTMKYNTTSNDLTVDTSGNDVNFSNDTLTTTGDIRFENAGHVRIREAAFAAFTGATAPTCSYVNELAVDTTTKALYVCTATGAPGGTWKSADNNPAAGTSAGNTLYWNGTAWVESNALTNNGGVVTVTNGNTFTANGPVNIGDGGDTVAVNSSTWDITGPGVVSGLTGITSTGAINFSGASSLSLASVAVTNPLTCAEGDLVYNQTTNLTYICTAANTWTALASGTVDFEAVYGADADKSLSITDNLATGFAIKEGANTYINLATTNGSELVSITPATTIAGTTTLNGIAAIGDGGDTVTINSSDWDISAVGNMTNIGSINMDGLLTGTAGATISGAVINFNASSNFATNIGTGTSTGTVSIGGGSNDVTVNGKVVGLTSTGAGNDITMTAADDIIFDDAQLTGIVQMSDTATDWAATLSSDGIVDNINSFTSTASGEGASNIGINDAGGFTSQTDVEGALQEIYGKVGSNAANVEDLTFSPEYPDAVVYPDGTNNRGTLESFYDATNNVSYYDWKSTNATTQDMGVRFDFPLPADFVTPGNFTFQYRTGTVTTADNNVEVRFYNKTDSMTLCDSDLTNGTAGTWTTGTLSALATGCTGATALGAGDIVEVEVKFFDNTGAADYADVGYLKLVYNN